MASITITDLNNAKLDVDHIAAIATSPAATAADRLGVVKSTLAGFDTRINNDADGIIAKFDTRINNEADGILVQSTEQAEKSATSAAAARDASSYINTYINEVVMNVTFPLDLGLVSDSVVYNSFDLGAI